MIGSHKIAFCDNKNTMLAPNMSLQLFHYITSDIDKSFLALCHLGFRVDFFKSLPLYAVNNQLRNPYS